MNLIYEINADLQPEDVAELFRDSGLRRPVDDLERIGRMLANANLTISARDGARLVGIARALTDFGWCCYVSDLAVARDYQKQGIGKDLLARVSAAVGEETAVLLLSAPEAHAYYPHIGFQKIENGWIIPRKRL